MTQQEFEAEQRADAAIDIAVGMEKSMLKALGDLAVEQEKTAEATEVIKQLVDATAAVEWGRQVLDYVTDEQYDSCPNPKCHGYKDEGHTASCDLDAQLTKARAFLDGLGD
jgi:hypothetical protein